MTARPAAEGARADSIEALRWEGSALRLLDQRALPGEVSWIDCRSWREVASAIAAMVVRGAPAIGIAAAYGMALAAGEALREPAAGGGTSRRAVLAALREAGEGLMAARPTAVNLGWAVRRQLAVAERHADGATLAARLLEEAGRVHEEDRERNLAIGRLGSALLPPGARVYTHCNTGSLATGGYGTALGVVRAAHAAGRLGRVWAGETRPLLQGARLTMWELAQDGIPATLVVDSCAASLMAAGRVDAVVVGADRIARNGDVANKVGTLALAVLARHFSVPFYVAAPWSTVDRDTPSGDGIAIEERDPGEVVSISGVDVAPPGAPAWNPAFDVTPAELVGAIVTERGVLRPPLGAAIERAEHLAGDAQKPPR